MDNLNDKILNATKWSSITEIIAKLITPITNIILARILVPEVFGVIATITMITSFADMFTDAGFQKYLVQNEFKDEEEKNLYTNVAFWTNLILSLVIWIIIIIFSKQLAILVGNPSLGNVICIACIQLPMTSFSSIQMAVYRRSFDFKTLFLVRIIGTLTPFLVTIPLAMLGYSYWALIIGNIFGALSNAIILTIKSDWKPKLIYKFYILKEMLSFSIWSLVEAIAIWLTVWIDIFIIGTTLNSYYIGIYKTSLSTVNSIFSLVTASTTPILFTALSRTQKNDSEFNKIFFSMQRIVSYLVMPMSIGIYVYSELIGNILLGSEWQEANEVIGIWAILYGLIIVLGYYSSEVYRAKGKPKLSFIAQLLHLIVLIPTCMIVSKYDFYTLVRFRSLIRLELVFVHFVFMHFIIKISVGAMIKNISIPLIASILMGILAKILKLSLAGFTWQVISILICIIFYIIILISFKSSRNDILIAINNTKISEIILKKFKGKSISNIITNNIEKNGK